MKRTTVKISDELDARLRHVAEREGKTVSEVTREALEAYVGGHRRRGVNAAGRNGARLSFTAAGRSGDGTIAERIEEILAKEWAGRDSR